MVYTKDNTAYLNDDWQVYLLFTDSSVVYIDDQNRDIMNGNVQGSFYQGQYQQRVIYPNMYFSEVAGPYAKEWWRMFASVVDTTIDDITYRLFHVAKRDEYSFNAETKKYDIPHFYDVYYYFNLDKQSLDRVVLLPEDTASNLIWKEEFIINTVLGINADTLLDGIFDTISPKYMGFSRHIDGNAPFSFRSSKGVSDSLTLPTLHFPLVDLSGDTSNIMQQEGWVLLDFWIFGCPGCRQQHLKWRGEQETYGSTVIEREGITIISINPVSDNAELISREAAMYCPANVKIYHAKGMNTCLKMNTFPQYYLVSPDKQIVYSSGLMRSYDQILEAKRHVIDNNTQQR